jgi:hypothetical protein
MIIELHSTSHKKFTNSFTNQINIQSKFHKKLHKSNTHKLEESNTNKLHNDIPHNQLIQTNFRFPFQNQYQKQIGGLKTLKLMKYVFKYVNQI